jgi:uncharacterized protein YndB with AHSA1/START domain
VSTDRPGSAVIEFPSELEVVATREFDAPIELVFDVMTKPEYVRKTVAPFDEEVKVCSIDLRAGGDYRFVFVTGDGKECSFRGTYVEVEPPLRTVATWRFDGWPGVEAVESMELHEVRGATRMTWKLAFRDKACRDHMTKYDGIEANLDNVEKLLASLADRAR